MNLSDLHMELEELVSEYGKELSLEVIQEKGSDALNQLIDLDTLCDMIEEIELNMEIV